MSDQKPPWARPGSDLSGIVPKKETVDIEREAVESAARDADPENVRKQIEQHLEVLQGKLHYHSGNISAIQWKVKSILESNESNRSKALELARIRAGLQHDIASLHKKSPGDDTSLGDQQKGGEKNAGERESLRERKTEASMVVDEITALIDELQGATPEYRGKNMDALLERVKLLAELAQGSLPDRSLEALGELKRLRLELDEELQGIESTRVLPYLSAGASGESQEDEALPPQYETARRTYQILFRKLEDLAERLLHVDLKRSRDAPQGQSGIVAVFTNPAISSSLSSQGFSAQEIEMVQLAADFLETNEGSYLLSAIKLKDALAFAEGFDIKTCEEHIAALDAIFEKIGEKEAAEILNTRETQNLNDTSDATALQERFNAAESAHENLYTPLRQIIYRVLGFKLRDRAEHVPTSDFSTIERNTFLRVGLPQEDIYLIQQAKNMIDGHYLQYKSNQIGKEEFAKAIDTPLFVAQARMLREMLERIRPFEQVTKGELLTKAEGTIGYELTDRGWEFQIPAEFTRIDHLERIDDHGEIHHVFKNGTFFEAVTWMNNNILGEDHAVPLRQERIPRARKRMAHTLTGGKKALRAVLAAIFILVPSQKLDEGQGQFQREPAATEEPAGRTDPGGAGTGTGLQKPAEAVPQREGVPGPQIERAFRPDWLRPSLLNPEVGDGNPWGHLKSIFKPALKAAGITDKKSLRYATDFAKDYIDVDQKTPYFEDGLLERVLDVRHKILSARQITNEARLRFSVLFGDKDRMEKMLARIDRAPRSELPKASKEPLKQIIRQLYEASQ